MRLKTKKKLLSSTIILLFLLFSLYLGSIQNTRDEKSLNKTGAGQTDFYKVINIIDGDTIDISIEGVNTRLRLLGVNTPETNGPYRQKECFGEEAKNEVKNLLVGRRVSIKYDPIKKDKKDVYGRELVYVYRDDGLFVNAHLVQNGFAKEYTYKNEKYTFQDFFKTNQTVAKNKSLGIWGVCG